MYKFSKTSKFTKSIKKLPKNTKENLKNKLLLMENNPFHPSLRSKKNITASTKFSDTVYESSINMQYRYLWKFENDEIILLLLAGKHDIVE